MIPHKHLSWKSANQQQHHIFRQHLKQQVILSRSHASEYQWVYSKHTLMTIGIKHFPNTLLLNVHPSLNLQANQNLIYDQLWLFSERMCLSSTILSLVKWEILLYPSNMDFKLFLGHKFTIILTIQQLLFTDLIRLMSDGCTDWHGHEISKLNLFNSCIGWKHYIFIFLYLNFKMPIHKCKCYDYFYEQWTFIKWGKSPSKALCAICNASFNIEKGENSDVNQNILTTGHEKLMIFLTSTNDIF